MPFESGDCTNVIIHHHSRMILCCSVFDNISANLQMFKWLLGSGLLRGDACECLQSISRCCTVVNAAQLISVKNYWPGFWDAWLTACCSHFKSCDGRLNNGRQACVVCLFKERCLYIYIPPLQSCRVLIKAPGVHFLHKNNPSATFWVYF